MRTIKYLKNARLNDPVIALGNFDGVHLGHLKVLKKAAAFARKHGSLSAALTFDPHPQQVVSPERGLRLLTTISERKDLINATGVDDLIVIKFGERLRKMSYDSFVRDFLVGGFGVRKVFVGFDYAFGKKRKGDVRHLRRLGKRFGFSVSVVPAVSVGGVRVKSSSIRKLVSSGRFNEAVKLLGHPYVITGRVVAGKGRGRRLGFPTANINVDENKLIPLSGVYAGVVRALGGLHKCVVNIGARPTFPSGGNAVEVHILNFRRAIRGRVIEVLLSKRFRDERQFSDVRELKKQISRDVARAGRAVHI